MTKYFAATTVPPGFFNEKTDDTDAIKISDELWAALLEAQSNGMMISVGEDGRPIAIPLPVVVDSNESKPPEG